MKLKRATTLEFTTISAIIYSTCYQLGVLLSQYLDKFSIQSYCLFVFKDLVLIVSAKTGLVNSQALWQVLDLAMACATCHCA